ncbi:MAG: glycosyltransferase family 4 protein [Acidimicrobiia bacterium]|nr:glycosyltransferase family 4 protein [Acidimicrobiia bacterium]
MRILSITAGAAGMYCGSCFRDNALAIELLARGQEVSLVPIYTPTRTDEQNVSDSHVLFGGISVYLQQHASLFRKTPRFLDRLWDSPRVISTFSKRAVQTDARMLGDLTVSMLEGEHGVIRKEFEKLVDWIRDEPAPDIINIPNSILIALAEPLGREFGRPVCCTLQGEELFIDGLPPVHREKALSLIRRQVQYVDRFIAVSDYCARFMGELLQIPADRMATVPLGINTTGYGPHAPNPDIFTVGYFARIAPEKGLHLLAEAYVHFRRRIGNARAQLRAAGYSAPGRSPYLDGIRQSLQRAGLAHEFIYEGEVDRNQKLDFLRSLDVLSVPATYDEPKGLFLIEAMASGVPVVQPRRGAFIETVESTGGGILVDPDSAEALGDGLHRLWSNRTLRQSLGTRAVAGVQEHYTIARSTSHLLEVYDSVVRDQAGRPLQTARR